MILLLFHLNVLLIFIRMIDFKQSTYSEQFMTLLQASTNLSYISNVAHDFLVSHSSLPYIRECAFFFWLETLSLSSYLHGSFQGSYPVSDETVFVQFNFNISSSGEWNLIFIKLKMYVNIHTIEPSQKEYIKQKTLIQWLRCNCEDWQSRKFRWP